MTRGEARKLVCALAARELQEGGHLQLIDGFSAENRDLLREELAGLVAKLQKKAGRWNELLALAKLEAFVNVHQRRRGE